MKWPMIPLDKVAEIRGGATPSRNDATYWNGNIPWLTPRDLPRAGNGISNVEKTPDSITEKGLASSSANLLPPGTVLFSSRASIGKVGIATVPLTTNQGFANFIPRPEIQSRYLAWCLSFYADQIADLAGSTTFREVTKNALRSFRIPLPPLPEQCRIVKILDQADHLRHLRAEADAKTDRILPALFLKMFGDPNQPTLPVVQLSSLIDCLDHKRIPVRESERAARIGDVPYFGANGLVGYIDEPIFNETLVLLAEDGGNWGPTEQCAYKIEGPSWVNNHAHVLRCKEELDSDYLVWSLVLLDLRRFITGTTRGKLTQGGMNAIELPAPSRSLQKKFGRYARTQAELGFERRVATQELQTLFTSLIHRAFSGSLTDVWRQAQMRELVRETDRQAKALPEA